MCLQEWCIWKPSAATALQESGSFGSGYACTWAYWRFDKYSLFCILIFYFSPFFILSYPVTFFSVPKVEMIDGRLGSLAQEFKDLVYPSNYNPEGKPAAKRKTGEILIQSMCCTSSMVGWEESHLNCCLLLIFLRSWFWWWSWKEAKSWAIWARAQRPRGEGHPGQTDSACFKRRLQAVWSTNNRNQKTGAHRCSDHAAFLIS